MSLEVLARIEELRAAIRRHEYLYYVKTEPEVTDAEFDGLMAELAGLEKAHPAFLTPDSPTQRVGGAVSSFAAVPHRVPMMSLENAYSMGDLADWLARAEKAAGKSVFPVVVDVKVDGVSAGVTYSHQTLQTALTRGDGQLGDDVTQNIRTIKTLPLRISSSYDMDLRGEVYVPKARLEALNRRQYEGGLEPYKNCRNLAAGTLKSLDPKVPAERGLRIVFYGIAQALELGFSTHTEVLAFLKQEGFPVNRPSRLCSSMAEIQAFLAEIEQQRDVLPFDIDGAVLKIDDLRVRAELGDTSKAPRWAIAFKFRQQQAITRLASVVWQVGRGQLTPVAMLEPVELGGTTVSRASLHNIDQIKEKDIRVGDFVVVEKAGYIIPYVVESLKNRRNGAELPIVPPALCPICQAPTTNEERPEESTLIRCSNPDCQGVLARRMMYFVSQLEMENIGPQLIERLIMAGFLTEVTDVFSLNKASLLTVDRMGEKLAEKILLNIEAGKSKPLAKVIAALGIPNVGKVVAESLAGKYQTLAAFRLATLESMQDIFGVGEKVAEGVQQFLQSPRNQGWLDALEDNGIGATSDKNAESVSLCLAGKLFVVTGEATRSRREIEDLIKKHGGKVSSAVSAKTQYLIIGSLESADFQSSKKSKALQLHVPIIDEHQLLHMIS
jgi:DNA ligase (NAD+)